MSTITLLSLQHEEKTMSCNEIKRRQMLSSYKNYKRHWEYNKAIKMIGVLLYITFESQTIIYFNLKKLSMQVLLITF